MTTPAHPYQPGTVWAPKKGKGEHRRLLELWHNHHTDKSWVMCEGKRTRARWEIRFETFRRWAGDIIGGCPVGHGDQCCGNPAACLEALRDD